MEDKRIIKTKKTIKTALIDVLQETSFEKASVTAICDRGIVSRITFYNHYEDKYVLAEELFTDYIAETVKNYQRLQSTNNPTNLAFQGYMNLLEAILQLYYENYRFFSHVTAQENPYLHSLFFRKVLLSVDDYLKHHRGLISRFPEKQTAALLCNGMFGVIDACIEDKISEIDVRRMAPEIYSRLLKSDLFIQ